MIAQKKSNKDVVESTGLMAIEQHTMKQEEKKPDYLHQTNML